MFHHILFPIDFSERCKQVVPLIRSLANRYGANVTLMHVFQIPAGWYGGMEGVLPNIFDLEKMEQDTNDKLAEFYLKAEGDAVNHKVDTIVTQGDPGCAIVHQASQSDIDLIAMPTHGYGRFRRFLLGSVTAQVLHDAHCPVWTAAHAEDPGMRNHSNCRSILCAVDGTKKSLPLIRSAALLASELTANLHLVHAIPLFPEPDVVLSSADEGLFLNSARREIENLQREAGARAGICVAAGNISEVVRESAVRHGADLVVVGRGRIQERFGGLRSNAYAIIRDSPCPVISL